MIGHRIWQAGSLVLVHRRKMAQDPLACMAPALRGARDGVGTEGTSGGDMPCLWSSGLISRRTDRSCTAPRAPRSCSRSNIVLRALASTDGAPSRARVPTSHPVRVSVDCAGGRADVPEREPPRRRKPKSLRPISICPDGQRSTCLPSAGLCGNLSAKEPLNRDKRFMPLLFTGVVGAIRAEDADLLVSPQAHLHLFRIRLSRSYAWTRP